MHNQGWCNQGQKWKSVGYKNRNGVNWSEIRVWFGEWWLDLKRVVVDGGGDGDDGGDGGGFEY